MARSGNSNTTLEDLAKIAGVSVSTVSRALNDEPVISARTKQRIWAIAREHDYPFRHYMPATPIGAEGVISIVTPHVRGRPVPLSHTFFLELIAQIGEAARSRDCDFMVSHISPTTYEDLVHAVTTSRATGVIFLGQGQLHAQLNQLASTNERFVVWGARMEGQRYCSVGSDNVSGGRRATIHLARIGRKRIMFLGGTDPEASQRRQGYQKAIAEAGLDTDPALLVNVEFELEAAEAAVARAIHEGTSFDGIVAASDMIALGAMRALQGAGISVPHQVSVVGYDDMLISRLSSPSLSTIRQDTAEAGRLLVARILDFSTSHAPSFLPTDLVVRESCGVDNYESR